MDAVDRCRNFKSNNREITVDALGSAFLRIYFNIPRSRFVSIKEMFPRSPASGYRIMRKFSKYGMVDVELSRFRRMLCFRRKYSTITIQDGKISMS